MARSEAVTVDAVLESGVQVSKWLISGEGGRGGVLREIVEEIDLWPREKRVDFWPKEKRVCGEV